MGSIIKLTHKVDTVTGLSEEFTKEVLEAFRQYKAGLLTREIAPVLAGAFDKFDVDVPEATLLHGVVGEIIGVTIINNLPKALTGDVVTLRVSRCQFAGTPEPLAPPADAVPQILEVPSNTNSH